MSHPGGSFDNPYNFSAMKVDYVPVSQKEEVSRQNLEGADGSALCYSMNSRDHTFPGMLKNCSLKSELGKDFTDCGKSAIQNVLKSIFSVNRNKKTKRTLTVVTRLALLVFVLSGTLRAFPLWGNLQAGPYAVGYKTLFTYDLSRPPLVDSNGSVNTRTSGRPMQISIWYPAQTLRRSSYMRFEDYVFLSARELDFTALTEEKKQQARRAFMEAPLSRGASPERLEALMRVETAAIRNALPVRERFPLVVFAHSSPPAQSIMCEYLASHGFIVVAAPSKGTFEYEFDVGLSGLETLIKDMEFILSSTKTNPQFDGKNLGLIGMSFGSAGVVGFHTRHPEVRAMISLDGGIGEGGVSFLITKTPYYDASRVTAPLLHLYTPNNPHLDLTRLESYKYSTRYLVSVPRMRHGDFVAYGMLEQFVPKMAGDSPGDTKSGFEWVCRYSLSFLEAYLNNDAPALAFLQRPAEANGAPQDLMTVSVKPKLRAPPSTRELKAVLGRGGIEHLVALYRERKGQDPQPFLQSSFVELNNLLVAARNYRSAKQITSLFVDSYPSSVRAHLALAAAAEQLGERELASNEFAQALGLINDDVDLDYRARKMLEQAARQGLLRLK